LRNSLRIALGSDEKSPVTDFLGGELEARGHQVSRFGALGDGGSDWPDVAVDVARAVASGDADEGVLLCWTGTGVSIAANKVPGVRAALCADAETARGARAWNQANVLCLSLRTTTEALAREILDAWFAAEQDSFESANVDKVRELDALRESAAASLKN
jgi:ribose 5-phosphate isomerase B